MKTIQKRWTAGSDPFSESAPDSQEAQLALVFGATDVLKQPSFFESIRHSFPNALVFGCSTSGEICDTTVSEHSAVVTGVRFDHSEIRGAQAGLSSATGSFSVGEQLAAALPPAVHSDRTMRDEPLAHVLVLSDGLKVNGSDLVRGLSKHLPKDIAVTGGLAGDGERFAQTLVLFNDAPQPDRVAVLGLYGSRLKVGFGSLGGWDPFGPDRLITKSKGNVLYELDGHSALGLYKTYLGAHAKGLPATGLLFPLSLRLHTNQSGVVRTILGIDEKEQSLIFAGDLPEGTYGRLMKANVDRLIDGASGAAKTSLQALEGQHAQLALLISCIGRKLVLRQRVEEEIESVREVLGSAAALAGFYSYGEICPFVPGGRCELHNQTMTITTLSES